MRVTISDFNDSYDNEKDHNESDDEVNDTELMIMRVIILTRL